MSEEARFVGGPLHGHLMVVRGHEYVVPVMSRPLKLERWDEAEIPLEAIEYKRYKPVREVIVRNLENGRTERYKEWEIRP